MQLGAALNIAVIATVAAVAHVSSQATAAESIVRCARQVSACRCETTDGRVVDLSPLAKSGGGFAFSSRPGPSGNFRYSYNPCGGATCDGSVDAAACQRSADGMHEYLLGTQSSAKFDTDPSVGLYLKYSGVSGDRLQRDTWLQLVCDTSGSGVDLLTPLDDGILVVGQQSIVYKMSLLSGHSCAQGSVGPGGGGGGGGPSGGDILLIVFFSAAFAYLAVGLAVNILARKQSGFGALPNLAFWTALPALVVDGAAFAYASGKAAVTSRMRGGEYQSI